MMMANHSIVNWLNYTVLNDLEIKFGKITTSFLIKELIIIKSHEFSIQLFEILMEVS